MLTGAVPWPADLAARYRREGYWRDESLANLLRAPAVTAGTRTAVAASGQRISYAELDRRADQLTAGLRELGAAAGDRFVVQLPNRVELLAVCVALFRLGAIPVLALASHRKAEIGYLCEHAEATGLVIPDVHLGFDHRAMAREIRSALPGLRHVLVAGEPDGFTALGDVASPPADLPPPDPDEVALCLLSGGTTGLPKLIPRTHNDYLCQLRGTAREMGLDESGAYLAALPIAHNAALGCPGALGALWAGAKVVLAGSPAPDEVFPLIATEAVTLTTLMPAFLPLWASTVDLFDVDLSRLVIEVGGARLDPAVARSAEHALGCTITRWFGMAEGILCFTRVGEPARVRHETEGRPLWPADEIRVVDEHDRDVRPGGVGELLVRGPSVLRGYFRAPEYNATAFTAAGFLCTGDLVRMTPEGNMVVEGRLKDVVNRGGEKVPTAEVEDHLRAHPGVKDVAVAAVPDPALGERTYAFVIPAGPPPSLRDLRDFLTGRGLAAFKLPDQLELIGSFPFTPVGKVDKAALRASCAAGQRG
jgi:2,3-dihydroxybenzoate-AMP ligase